MKSPARSLFVVAAASLALALTAASADAKGCIKGAIVGGAAGHLAHHTFLGAAAGCVIGHHEAAKKEKELQAQPANGAPSDAPATTPKQ
ncbi:MAG TPA: hypothetical protein VH206_08350 [Xanthobacteraceae bacterium]|jgi:hypothetical protein|nr:hypothetical protein [Xanthobacteraceae bacterium]